MFLVACSSNQPIETPQVITKSVYVLPPGEYIKNCYPNYPSKTLRAIIAAQDKALRRCNARIDAIQNWKEEIQKQEKEFREDNLEDDS